jgi:5-hydroxyisourate hydrolase-like protein (transthyretin family)
VVAKPGAPRFALGDLVWMDLDRSGTQDPGEPPAHGVSVQLLDADGSVVDSSVTSPAGRYWFDQLPAGTYSVRFAGVPSGHRLTKSGVGNGADDSDADATGTTAPITLAVDAAGTRAATADDGVAAGYVNPTADAGIVALRFAVGGHVWADLNADGVEQENEPPSTASVSLFDSRDRVIATTTTDAQGRYGFSGLPAGRYRVQFLDVPPNRAFAAQRAGGDRTRDSDVDPATGMSREVLLRQDSTSVQPVSDSDVRNADYVDSGIDAGLIGSFSVGGTVWRDLDGDGVLDVANGGGVKGVKVKLLDHSHAVVGTRITSSRGRYTFDRLPAGSYQLQFSHLPTGLRFTAQHQGSNPAVDSDADAYGLSPVVRLDDDHPADTTVDAGVTRSASYQGRAPGANGAAPAVDSSLSSTGGVEPAIPVGGLVLVAAGATCLVIDRRRRASGLRRGSDSDSTPTPDH